MVSEELLVTILMQGGVSALYLGGVLYWIGNKFEKTLSQNTEALARISEVIKQCEMRGKK